MKMVLISEVFYVSVVLYIYIYIYILDYLAKEG